MTLNELLAKAILIKFGWSYHFPDESTIYLVFNEEDGKMARIANKAIIDRQNLAKLSLEFVQQHNKLKVFFWEEYATIPFVEILVFYSKKEFEFFIGDTDLKKDIPMVFEYLKPDGSIGFSPDPKTIIIKGYQLSLQ